MGQEGFWRAWLFYSLLDACNQIAFALKMTLSDSTGTYPLSTLDKLALKLMCRVGTVCTSARGTIATELHRAHLGPAIVQGLLPLIGLAGTDAPWSLLRMLMCIFKSHLSFLARLLKSSL